MTQAMNAAEAEQTIDAHNERRGWEIESRGHGLAMLLMDLIEYADEHHIDFDEQVGLARETLLDLRVGG